MHTVLGVSNISFGLPERERINASFFTLAMSRGLSAGIVNPMSAPLMDAYFAFNALNGMDENCAKYVARFSAKNISVKEAAAPAGKTDLFDAVVKGLSKEAYHAASTMTAETPSLEIIDQYLIPALDRAGRDFERKTIFLPQLLMSAEAAKSAFEAVKTYMAEKGDAREKRGKILLATVWGDIHDIGKNIVKILLENYNFEVIDLGKNVPPELIAETVKKENIRLAGLSALMTTTVVNMDETIRLLRQEAPNCRIMVGGAVLTQEYADRIGADFYSADAMGGVRYAEEFFEKP
jgi:5-methyltetrahydrofolate--homocysteine methyltransferase